MGVQLQHDDLWWGSLKEFLHAKGNTSGLQPAASRPQMGSPLCQQTQRFICLRGCTVSCGLQAGAWLSHLESLDDRPLSTRCTDSHSSDINTCWNSCCCDCSVSHTGAVGRGPGGIQRLELAWHGGQGCVLQARAEGVQGRVPIPASQVQLQAPKGAALEGVALFMWLRAVAVRQSELRCLVRQVVPVAKHRKQGTRTDEDHGCTSAACLS